MMKRILTLMSAMLIVSLIAGGTGSMGAGLFKMAFKFQADGKSFAAGEYRVEQKGERLLVFRQESTGKETAVSFIEKLPAPEQPIEEPRLVFAMVGNFEPSYTEYVTEYVLKEVWLDGENGFLLRAFKGAHQSHIVKGRRSDG